MRALEYSTSAARARAHAPLRRLAANAAINIDFIKFDFLRLIVDRAADCRVAKSPDHAEARRDPKASDAHTDMVFGSRAADMAGDRSILYATSFPICFEK